MATSPSVSCCHIGTVQNHVQNTLTKLQLHNKAQLIRYAIQQGIE
jgi:DNA-binding NarL/FixJ family response regulator